MAYFATPGIGTGATIHLGPTQQDATKQPEEVSATPTFSVSKVLGRSIPIVIGTGKVDGIPVIGGSNTVSLVTGYTTEQLVYGKDYPPGTQFPDRVGFGPLLAMIPNQSSQVTAMLGYLLAYDPFGDGYKLVRLEVNDTVVYDAENGIGASDTFRFYGGNHTAIDPITKTNIGADAGAWQNFAMVYLAGYAADSAPTVKAVISNAATSTPGSGDIAWTGPAPSGVMDAFPHGSAYDPTEGIIYQILEPTDIPGLTQIYLAVLDANTRVERYRVPLEGSEPYLVGAGYQLSVPVAMPGSGMLLIQLRGATSSMSGIYDAATGHLLASWLDTVNMQWLTAQPFGQLWAFVGNNFDTSALVTGVFDVVKRTFDVNPAGAAARNIVTNGRRTTTFCSFFTVESHFGGTADAYELKFNGDGWTDTHLLSLTGDTPVVDVLWFDPLTGYLVILRRSTPRQFLYVNPDTGAVADSFTTSEGGTNVSIGLIQDRLISRPGFVLMLAWTDLSHFDIRLLDIAGKSISTFASGLSAPDDLRKELVIVDQSRASYITALGQYVWTVHKQPSTIPGAITLQTLLTKAMSLVGYTHEELTFEGLSI